MQETESVTEIETQETESVTETETQETKTEITVLETVELEHNGTKGIEIRYRDGTSD